MSLTLLCDAISLMLRSFYQEQLQGIRSSKRIAQLVDHISILFSQALSKMRSPLIACGLQFAILIDCQLPQVPVLPQGMGNDPEKD